MEPDVLVSRLDEALPGFAWHFEGWGYLFVVARRPEHPVFAACADFIQQRPVPTGAWPRLAKIISDLAPIFRRLWRTRIPKAQAQGIHGTYFVGLDRKKPYYPTRRDEEAINPDGTRLRAGPTS